jgi:hypothetical protein
VGGEEREVKGKREVKSKKTRRERRDSSNRKYTMKCEEDCTLHHTTPHHTAQH